jgi:hypothetical protein
VIPLSRLAIASALMLAAGCVAPSAQTASSTSPALVIQEQGSFAVGGTVVTAPGTFDPIAQGAYNPAGADPRGQTLHGDHTYVFYQVPANARRLPLVFWHGHGQSGKTWETTPDGREGFQTMFLRRRFSVYLLDQPRRGRAARSTQPVTVPATPDDQLWFGIFRLGVWPDLYPGVQFSRDRTALEQFFQQMVPNTGPYDAAVNTTAVSALFDKIGQGVLVTHSHPAFAGFARLMLPWDDRRDDPATPLRKIGSLLPYHSHVDPAVVVSSLNRMIDDVSVGRTIFYDIYTDARKQAEPSHTSTGVFFLRGKPGAPFAVIAPGGGFAYVASLHEGFPYAVEISNRGYNAFVVKYRAAGGGTVATEDLAAALSFIFRNAGALGVTPGGYSRFRP